MTRVRVVEVTAGDLERIPGRCRRCLFWELGAPRPIDGEVGEPDEFAGDPTVQKPAWWRAVELGDRPGGGPGTVPGRAVMIGGETAGWCLAAPSGAFAPRRPPVPRPSDDALLLATLWVEPAFRGRGVGRRLVQAVAKEALRTGHRAVEAYGDRRHREGACVLPGTWLLHEGFEVRREHPRYPLLRLDVDSIARWVEPLEQAVERALGRLARQRRPDPAPERSPLSSRDAPAPDRSGARPTPS